MWYFYLLRTLSQLLLTAQEKRPDAIDVLGNAFRSTRAMLETGSEARKPGKGRGLGSLASELNADLDVSAQGNAARGWVLVLSGSDLVCPALLRAQPRHLMGRWW